MLGLLEEMFKRKREELGEELGEGKDKENKSLFQPMKRLQKGEKEGKVKIGEIGEKFSKWKERMGRQDREIEGLRKQIEMMKKREKEWEKEREDWKRRLENMDKKMKEKEDAEGKGGKRGKLMKMRREVLNSS